jgi:hypothetical protein
MESPHSKANNLLKVIQPDATIRIRTPETIFDGLQREIKNNYPINLGLTIAVVKTHAMQKVKTF